MKRALAVILISAAAIAGLQIAGCKQGEGERCQVDEDCTMPLICNKAKNTCANGSSGLDDAELPVDAPIIIDAPPPDAPPVDSVPAG